MKKIIAVSLLLLIIFKDAPAQIAAGKYLLKLSASMKALDADRGQMNTNGGKVQLWDACADFNVNCEPQVWEITDAQGGYYWIKLAGTGKYLTADNSTASEKSYGKVHLWEPCTNRCEQQLWRITALGDNRFSISSFKGQSLNVNELQLNTNGAALYLSVPNKAAAVVNSTPGSIWTVFRTGLRGIVDMHTHPMSHLGFGGKVMHGAPDEQTLMLSGSVYRGSDIGNLSNCRDSLRPGSINIALSRCDAVHGGWEGSNNCGDVIRSSVVGKLDKIYKYFGYKEDGFPDFKVWPHQTSVTHQQMWYQWIKRAYDGGLRVMVSLAVHNGLLTKIVNGQMYTDDKSSADLQIREMKSFVSRHADFMEIAKSPEDLIRINNANKLAIILGIEVDDIGNFSYNRAYNKVPVTINDVKTELQRLYDMDVRYLFPIHMSNNAFGGTAVNSELFALISKYYTNNYIEVDNVCNEGLGYDLKVYDVFSIGATFDRIGLRSRDVGYIVDRQPVYTPPTAGCGHANSLGLTSLGINTLLEMMKMGFIIDIDHMSRKSMKSAIAVSKIFRNYPLNSGHNGIGPEGGNERNLSTEIVDSIYKTGGMVGIGSTNALPSDFANNFMNVFRRMGLKNVAIGTDANGMEPLPRSTPGLNSIEFYRDFPLPKCQTGNRVWDYTNLSSSTIASTNGGVAHYGLMPEFFKDVSMQTNGTTIKNALNFAADDFLTMWQRCLRVAAGGR